MLDVFHKLPVSHDLNDGKVRSRDAVIDTKVKFSTLLLEPQIQDGLAKCGYIYLSPIQQNALPLALTGSSIIAHGKSGTGKTLTYVLPILNDFVKRKPDGLQFLVLAPTREISKQIYDVFRNVAYFVNELRLEYFIGGTPLDMDIIKSKNCHLAIGAPGRIKHLIDLGFLKTSNLELLVLDEVDALFDHKEYAIADILSLLPPPKQQIVCTATFSSKIGDLMKSIFPTVKYTSADALKIEEMGHISNMLIAIKQFVAPVKKDSVFMGAVKKREKLVEILRNFNFDQCFIFVNYMTLVRSICNYLISQNFSALWLCGDQNQSARINTINKLKMNHCKILVTTDLAARGIDVHKVNLVINLGLPCPPEIYIHRMGRAGRYGSEGAVITILNEGEEMTTFIKMVSVISTDIVDLRILPEQTDTSLSSLEIIRCLPSEGSISENEFSFKRHMKEDQENTALRMRNSKKVNKKKRKNATALKMTLQNGITYQSSTVNGDIVKNNVVNRKEESLVSSEVTNERIKQFSQSLIHLSVSGKLKPEWKSLKVIFGLKEGETIVDDSFTFILNPPDNLMTCALQVKQRNELIDEQVMPCSIDEFSSLLNSNNGISFYSYGLCSVIKETCGKIFRPVKQQFNVYQAISSSEKSSFDSEQLKNSNQVSRFNFKNFSQQLFDVIINDSEEKETCVKTIKNNAYLWPKNISSGFNLAEEFSNAMINYGEMKKSLSQEHKDSILSDQFLDASERSCKTERNRKKLRNLTSGVLAESHLSADPEINTESSLKSILVSENENKSNCAATVFPSANNTSNSIFEMKNFDNLPFIDDAAKEESSLLISNSTQKPIIEIPSDHKRKCIKFMNNYCQCSAECLKNSDIISTNKPHNCHIAKCLSNCNVMENKKCYVNLKNTIYENSRLGFKNVCQSRKPSSVRDCTIPITAKASFIASDSESFHNDSANCHKETSRLRLSRGDEVATPLPSLQSYVGKQQEQNIWQHHFAFIRRHAASRSEMANQQQ